MVRIRVRRVRVRVVRVRAGVRVTPPSQTRVTNTSAQHETTARRARRRFMSRSRRGLGEPPRHRMLQRTSQDTELKAPGGCLLFASLFNKYQQVF
jgi:hypothetical protein